MLRPEWRWPAHWRRALYRLSARRLAIQGVDYYSALDLDAQSHGVHDATIAFIQKPITPGAFARRVRETLDSESVGLYASGTTPIAPDGPSDTWMQSWPISSCLGSTG